MTGRKEGHGTLRTVVRIAIMAAGLASLGACASIPQRAWLNGEAMTASRGYRSVMGGNMSMESHRALQSSYNTAHMSFNTAQSYTPFGQWWY